MRTGKKISQNEFTFINEYTYQQIKERIEAVSPGDVFLNSVCLAFEREKQQADRNKNLYFKIEMAILIMSGLITLSNSVGLGIPKINTAMSILATAFSVLMVILLGSSELWKWKETWLRHREYVNAFNIECYKYAYYIGEYEAIYSGSGGNGEVKKIREKEECALRMFKNKSVEILAQNNARFLSNMSETDDINEKKESS